MPKYLNQIKALKKINKSIVINNKFLINKEGNIKIYYAPFDYVNSKAKIMIVGITPGLQQMLQSFQVINDGKSLKEVKDLSSFKGSMRTTLIKYMNALKVNKKYDLKLRCFLKGFPHPSGANARKNIQFKENKKNMKLLLRNK